jgi:hypothetical protein
MPARHTPVQKILLPPYDLNSQYKSDHDYQYYKSYMPGGLFYHTEPRGHAAGDTPEEKDVPHYRRIDTAYENGPGGNILDYLDLRVVLVTQKIETVFNHGIEHLRYQHERNSET